MREESTTRPPRVALVHDFLLDTRGAERVFAVLCAMYPRADVFTAVYDEAATEGRFAAHRVIASPLQRLRPTTRTFRALLPFYPAAIESLDLRGYDIVISSSSAWAHGVIPDEDAVHICYCHNPFRYAWSNRDEAAAAVPAPLRPAAAMTLSRWRTWDAGAARRVDRYVANSETTRRRIARYYGREADLVFPPVEVDRFAPAPAAEVGDEWVVVSELMAHKRIDVAVEAFTALGAKLVVAGKGPDARRLRRLAGPTVRFVGHVSDDEIARLLPRARGMVVTATEEFGIAAVEAQAAGRPVLALRAGGARETVREGVTGAFFDACRPDALADAVRAFDASAYDPRDCVESAVRFAPGVFSSGVRRIVAETVAEARPGGERAWARRRPSRLARGLASSA